MADYQPIACATHERLEFSVLRKIPLELNCADEKGEYQERVLPLDVATRDHAEWLKFKRENGEVAEIRLDSILSFKELQIGSFSPTVI